MSVQLTNFLRKQNKILKQETQEQQDLLNINRKALQVAIKDEKGNSTFPVLVNLLYEENSKLYAKINKMKLELETGMCQALISQQIAFASTQQQKNLTSELRDKLKKMRKQLQNRDKKISELSKQNNKGQTKIIEICDFSQAIKKLKDQIIDLNNQVDEKTREVYKYKEQKQELIKLNLVLTKQINQLKVISSHQSTKSNDINRSSKNSNDLGRFLNYQKKIVGDEDDDSEDQYKDYEEQSSSFSSSSLSFDEQESTSIPQQSKTQKTPKLEISKIPKLELSKAKQIQDLLVQKINQQGKKKQGTVKEEKYKLIQSQLNNARKKLGQMFLEKMELEKQNSFLTRIINELQFRNQLLLKDHKQKYDAHQNDIAKQKGYEETETLIDICRDVTMNQMLRDVISGEIQLQYNADIRSYDY